MSSTNRGGKRVPTDNYPTPAWCTRALMCWLYQRGIYDQKVLDPFAGEGAILNAAKWHGRPINDPRECAGIEIREEARRALESWAEPAIIGDALKADTAPWQDWAIVTNPPYSLAQECIQKWAPAVRWSAWLLRLNFLGSQKRAAWLRGDGRPGYVLVLPKRPSFTTKGTDSCEYAWFVWPARSGKTALEVLELSPCHPTNPIDPSGSV